MHNYKVYLSQMWGNHFLAPDRICTNTQLDNETADTMRSIALNQTCKGGASAPSTKEYNWLLSMLESTFRIPNKIISWNHSVFSLESGTLCAFKITNQTISQNGIWLTTNVSLPALNLKPQSILTTGTEEMRNTTGI